MPPPRRTAARNATATPARSTRGTSALAAESSVTRRSTRGQSQQPGPPNGVITSPDLPEVQTQQSYAYGSTKAPLLPDQLVASERMTLDQMASKLNAGVRQAEQRVDELAAEAEANFLAEGQKDARAERANRRGSREGSRETSVDSETRKTRRTAAWASSLDNSLENISEEGSPAGTPDDEETRRGTDPSSFPSGIYDHSYNYERGTRGPLVSPDTPGNAIGNSFSRIWQSTENGLANFYHFLERIVFSIGDFIIRVAQGILDGTTHFLQWIVDERTIRSLLRLILVTVLVAFVTLLAFTGFCKLYTGILCNPDSTSTIQLTLQEYCGACSASAGIPADLTLEDRSHITKLSKALNTLNKKVEEIEKRIDAKFDGKNADFTNSLEDLERQQRDLQLKIANIETRQAPSSHNFPLMQKINYFAPGTGALINPHRTSPTKQKQLPFYQKMILGSLGMRRHTSNPPVEALQPWEDVGDCWCSSDTHSPVRLGVDMGHLIYPTEFVIEHYPSSGIVAPDTTPRHVEIWADFQHFNAEEWAMLLDGQMEADPTMPSFGKIGEAVYDSGVEVSHEEYHSAGNGELWGGVYVFVSGTGAWGGSGAAFEGEGVARRRGVMIWERADWAGLVWGRLHWNRKGWSCGSGLANLKPMAASLITCFVVGVKGQSCTKGIALSTLCLSQTRKLIGQSQSACYLNGFSVTVDLPPPAQPHLRLCKAQSTASPSTILCSLQKIAAPRLFNRSLPAQDPSMVPLTLTIISGAQTGVDVAAIEAAIAVQIPYRGWVPHGFTNEAGLIPENYRPHLRQTPLSDNSQRTEWNIRDADCVLTILNGRPDRAVGGTKWGVDVSTREGKPMCFVDLTSEWADEITKARNWLRNMDGVSCSIAIGGPRESEEPGIEEEAKRILIQILGSD